MQGQIDVQYYVVLLNKTGRITSHTRFKNYIFPSCVLSKKIQISFNASFLKATLLQNSPNHIVSC